METLTKPNLSWDTMTLEELRSEAEIILTDSWTSGFLGVRSPMSAGKGLGKTYEALLRNAAYWIEGEFSEWSTLIDSMVSASTRAPLAVEAITPTIQRIRSFAGLAPDWDSYGARPLSSLAITTALELLVESHSLPIYQTNVEVDAAPSPSGGILVEWATPAGRFQLHVESDGSMAGVRIEVAKGVAVSWTDVPIATQRDVLEQLDRLA